MDIIIHSDCCKMFSTLRKSLPKGIKIKDAPIPPEACKFSPINIEIPITINITLSIDYLIITAGAAAGFIVHSLRKLRGNHQIEIDGQNIPTNDPRAIKVITKYIDNQKSHQDT